MGLTAEDTQVNEEGKNKDAFVLTFTNGALQQLEELTAHFKKENKLELMKMAISVLQLVKERDDKESES